VQKITDDEINITKYTKIKDIQCNNKVITNIVQFNLTISHSIKYSENFAGFGMATFRSFYVKIFETVLFLVQTK
jgi:hypothetical protein